MSKRDPLDVMHNRAVYRLSLNAFARFCRDRRRGGTTPLSHYGPRVATVSYVTDNWQPADFLEALEQEGLDSKDSTP